MRRGKLTVLIALIGMSIFATHAVALETIFVTHPYKGETRFNYHVALMNEALTKISDEDTYYVLKGIETDANESLLVRLLELGRIDLMFRPVSKTMENNFLPIRIPLDKGLLGWRLLLINKKKQTKFNQVKTLNDLQKIKLIQGQGWNDVLVYEFNGVPIFQENQFSKMFNIISKQADIDAFPRGIQEIFDEHDEWSKSYPQLAIEQSVVLHYDFVRYVWLKPNEQGQFLKNKIELGLEMMLEDGSFDEIFNQYFGDIIKKANLENRVKIELENPFMPDTVPYDREELWLNP